jgi:hypothetical protein
MDFQSERIKSHNQWPNISAFKGEQAFNQLLVEVNNNDIPFTTIKVGQEKDPDFQRCVAHLLDGLDALPRRPDYLFDHAFRTIELAGGSKSTGTKGLMQSLGNKLIRSGGTEWTQIISLLSENIPIRICELIAKRILLSSPRQDKEARAISERAEECLGTDRYNEFIGKFKPATSTKKDLDKQINKAGSFLKLYLCGNLATKAKKSPYLLLDLSKEKNLPDAKVKSELLLSLLLFVIRNERAHGSSISPFRTSKTSVERYEGYYYLALTTYIFALGAMQLHWKNTIDSNDILEGCQKNLDLQQKFFK